MSKTVHDRSLLLAVLALQNGFANRQQLIELLNHWSLNRPQRAKELLQDGDPGTLLWNIRGRSCFRCARRFPSQAYRLKRRRQMTVIEELTLTGLRKPK
ncbi:MAG TPA: hypothetical protein PKD64_16715 [Pirellulaceae bacterium]|nr:hypothetical protein [Pirellulaceae bacterium]HMO93830.1 hypothetical protein [Pirellulaceae bacterium]HMP71367.1 hypothetical protein [Pirellulaceae bacterium]